MAICYTTITHREDSVMDFKNIQPEELKELAEFFAIDVVAANPDKPTKKELVTALKTGEDPISDEDYETFKEAKATGQDKAPEVEELNAELAQAKAEKPEAEVVDTSNYVLVKFEGNNPRIDLVGHTFYKRHPFASVDPETAEYIVRNHEGFRLALPSEVSDYYG
jgi:hypothetical protein